MTPRAALRRSRYGRHRRSPPCEGMPVASRSISVRPSVGSHVDDLNHHAPGSSAQASRPTRRWWLLDLGKTPAVDQGLGFGRFGEVVSQKDLSPVGQHLVIDAGLA